MLELWISFFFFTQKTAYEMRISDWSSDVSSSDLFTLTLSQPSATAVEVPWTITLPGAPGAGADDLVGTVVLTGTATIPAGSTTVEIGPFTTANEAEFEPAQTFTVALRTTTGATVGQGTCPASPARDASPPTPPP